MQDQGSVDSLRSQFDLEFYCAFTNGKVSRINLINKLLRLLENLILSLIEPVLIFFVKQIQFF